jgi:hypothetical protein
MVDTLADFALGEFMLQGADKRPAALVVAHPGHEVRVSGWYELARPRLFVLTEGSRSGDQGRLLCAQSFANQNGAKLGSLFGRFRDREIYAAILAGDQTPFIRWTAQHTAAIVSFLITSRSVRTHALETSFDSRRNHHWRCAAGFRSGLCPQWVISD